MTNPYFLYILSFLCTLFLYQFKWSSLYPAISVEIYSFFLLTFIIAFTVGFSVKKKIKYVDAREIFCLKKLIFLIIILCLIEIINNSKLPLFEVLMTNKVNRLYGLPGLHAFILTFSSFLSVYIFHLLLSRLKPIYFVYIFITLMPSILFYSRGTLMITFITFIFVWLLKNRKYMTIKKWITIFLTIILTMYIFGFMGNLRSYGTNDVIYTAGGVTENYLKTNIPGEFFWSYIYLTSPIANLTNNILRNNVLQKIGFMDITGVILTETVPDVISNRLISILNITSEAQTHLNIMLVNSNLTVSTIFINSYIVLGWLGIILIFIFLILYVYILLKMLKIQNPFFVVGVSYINTMISLSFFYNMLGQSSAIAPIFYSIIFGFIVRKK